MKFKAYRYLIYGFAVLILNGVQFLPRKIGYFLGINIGKLLPFFLKKEVHKANSQLNMAYGDTLSTEKKNQIARNVFKNFSINAFEWVIQHRELKKGWENLVQIHGMENLDQVMSLNHGALMLTGHLGNWELLAGIIANIKNYHGAVVAKKIYFAPYNRLLVSLREKSGVDTVYQDESPKKLINILKKNGIVGILPDQDVRRLDGEFIKFFGIPAYTPKGPWLLSYITQAPILPCFMIRNGYKYSLFIEKPIFLNRNNPKKDEVIASMKKWTSLLEKYVRIYPDQWVWNHLRWKTKPDEIIQ